MSIQLVQGLQNRGSLTRLRGTFLSSSRSLRMPPAREFLHILRIKYDCLIKLIRLSKSRSLKDKSLLSLRLRSRADQDTQRSSYGRLGGRWLFPRVVFAGIKCPRGRGIFGLIKCHMRKGLTHCLSLDHGGYSLNRFEQWDCVGYVLKKSKPSLLFRYLEGTRGLQSLRCRLQAYSVLVFFELRARSLFAMVLT